MTSAKVLQVGRELIRDKAHWTTCAYARDANGHVCLPNHYHAVTFCAVGALARAASSESNGSYREALDYLRLAADRTIKHGTPSNVNDELGHDGVMSMYAIAIALAIAYETPSVD